MITTARTTTYTEDDVRARLNFAHVCDCGMCPKSAVVYLNRDGQVWNPADGGYIHGPGRIEILSYPNGITNVVKEAL